MGILAIVTVLVLVLASILALWPAAIAESKGRSFGGWWLFGLFLFIVALPASVIISTDYKSLEIKKFNKGKMRKCPDCAEIVQREAKVCKYCGKVLPEEKEKLDVW